MKSMGVRVRVVLMQLCLCRSVWFMICRQELIDIG